MLYVCVCIYIYICIERERERDLHIYTRMHRLTHASRAKLRYINEARADSACIDYIFGVSCCSTSSGRNYSYSLV